MPKKKATNGITVKKVSEVFALTKGDVRVEVELNETHMSLGKQYLFKNRRTPDNLKKWGRVIELLSAGVAFLKDKTKDFDEVEQI